ncbi:MAG: hypothetical protein ABIJ65_01180, partial [Chloroflexota bacterium]
MKTKLFLVSVIFLLVLTGCSTTSAPTPPAITYPTAQYTDQRTLVENAGGKIEVGMAGTLPSELPRDVPIFYP